MGRREVTGACPAPEARQRLYKPVILSLRKDLAISTFFPTPENRFVLITNLVNPVNSI